jgi:hypothetical protein
MNRRQKLFLISIVILVAQIACGTSPSTQEPVIPTQTVCPVETADLKLYKNVQDGYCLLYPAAYTLHEPRYIIIDPVEAPGDTLGQAWVDITVEAASGRTAAQTADQVIAEAGTGFNITRNEILVDGSQAIIVDGLPGQDPSRRLFIVSHDKLYTFVFVSWVPTADGSSPLEKLFDAIMSSLKFVE